MSKPRTHLAALQARAKAASERRGAQARVVVSRPAAAAADDESDVEGSDAPVAAELWLYGTVGGYWWGFNSDDVAEALRQIGDVTDLTVRLNSYGGSAIDGIAIANLLANNPAKVRIVVDGIAASAATQIALAGEELIMSPGSQFMVHDAWTFASGNAAELRSMADWIDKQSRNYAETYAHRAGGTADEWRKRMLADNGDGTWYTAAETVAAGLASRVANIASTGTPPPMPDPVDLDGDDDLSGDVAAASYDFEILLDPAARAAWSNSRAAGAPKPPAASASGSTTSRTGMETAMAFTPEQLTQMRQDLGLAETADEATITAALTEALAEQADAPAPNTPEIPEGMSLVDTAVLTDLRAGAQAGLEARTQQQAEARDSAIREALADGRIPPARREHYATAWDADPEGTRDLLASLAPGLVPVTELGHAAAAERSTEDALYASLYGNDEKKGA